MNPARGRVESVLAASGIPGAQVVHRVGGHIQTEVNHGVLDTHGQKPVTSRSVFQAASLSKVVFSYLVMRRLQAGLLDLDAPLISLATLPRLKDTADTVTSRMVLAHTTGFPNWASSPGDEESDLIPAFTPGSRFHYSGDAFFLLQRCLEALEGMPLDVAARQEVFEPWEMQDSSFVFRQEETPRTALGHTVDDGAVALTVRPTPMSRFTRANAGYSLTTSARDYSTFVHRALCQGRGLSANVYRQWLTRSSDAGLSDPKAPSGLPEVSWGLGVGLEEHRLGTAVWHWGDNGDHRAFFVAFPERSESICMFFNAEHGQRWAGHIVNALLPGLRLRCLEWVENYRE